MTKLADLFERYGAASLDKQHVFAKAIGNANWQFSMATGTLSFGSLRLPAQVLGSESEQSNTWLWAWANSRSNIPARLLSASLSIQQFGKRQRIQEFTQPQMAIDEVDGHVLSQIAVGILQASCYYKGPYSGGAAFLLVPSRVFNPSEQLSIVEVVGVFTQAISQVGMNQRRAFLHYMQYKGFTCKESDMSIRATSSSKQVIDTKFDLFNRMTSIEVVQKSCCN